MSPFWNQLVISLHLYTSLFAILREAIYLGWSCIMLSISTLGCKIYAHFLELVVIQLTGLWVIGFCESKNH